MQTQNIGQQAQNQQTAQAMQNRMKEPPQVITTKDYNYLTDALSWELGAVKKLHHFANKAQDAQTKNFIKKGVEMHQRHYNMLLKHLEPANSANKLQ